MKTSEFVRAPVRRFGILGTAWAYTAGREGRKNAGNRRGKLPGGPQEPVRNGAADPDVKAYVEAMGQTVTAEDAKTEADALISRLYLRAKQG
ncbi:MAG: hypothetical protein IKP72_18910 [Clostridia bacterium]|nr:hypothetical protein [Clostridia bacterium]